MSGYSAESDRRRARDAGFALHFTKPLNFESPEALITKHWRCPENVPAEGAQLDASLNLHGERPTPIAEIFLHRMPWTMARRFRNMLRDGRSRVILRS